jgi:hypothetical protein
MKLSWRRPRLLLSAAVAAGALAGLAVAAAPAYAGPTHISAFGGPGEILITGGGFNGGAAVRLEALTPDGSKVLSKLYVTADSGGYINDAYLNNFHGYTGDVWVAADGAPGPTAGAYTHVYPAPTLDASNPAPYCNGVVTVFGYNFQPGDTVRLTLLRADTWAVLAHTTTTVDSSTGIPPGFGNTVQLPLSGYSGPVQVFADESYPGNLTTGAYLSQAC